MQKKFWSFLKKSILKIENFFKSKNFCRIQKLDDRFSAAKKNRVQKECFLMEKMLLIIPRTYETTQY